MHIEQSKQGKITQVIVYLIIATAVFALGYWFIRTTIEENSSNGNTNNSLIQEVAVQFNLPEGYKLCQDIVGEGPFPGLVGYVWRDGTCDHTQDAPDFQIYVVNSRDEEVESIIYTYGSVTQDTRATLSTIGEREYYELYIEESGVLYVSTEIDENILYVQAVRIDEFQDSDVARRIIETAVIQ
ncbi:hypothetical protein ACFL0L_04190 [Patescibacteria group bacterium]